MTVLLWIVLQEDAAEAVRKAAEKTGSASYAYRVAGRFERTGEFRPEAVLASTIRQYRSARNGTRILIKGPEGLWKSPEERLGERVENPDRDAADIVATLRDAEPPHRMLLDTLRLCEKGTRGEDRSGCRVYWFRLADAELRASLERQMKKGDAPDSVSWSSMRSVLRVYVTPEGQVGRILDERSVKIEIRKEARLFRTEMDFTLSGFGTTRVDLPDEVREKLGVRD